MFVLLTHKAHCWNSIRWNDKHTKFHKDQFKFLGEGGRAGRPRHRHEEFYVPAMNMAAIRCSSSQLPNHYTEWATLANCTYVLNVYSLFSGNNLMILGHGAWRSSNTLASSSSVMFGGVLKKCRIWTWTHDFHIIVYTHFGMMRQLCSVFIYRIDNGRQLNCLQRNLRIKSLPRKLHLQVEHQMTQ